jgi:hypothetical protein
MKKSKFFGSYLMLAFLPAYLCAQNIQLPTVEIKVSQNLVPQAVKEAVLKDFGEGHKPIVWVTNETLFSADVWAQSANIENLDVYNYGLHSQTSTGCSLDAFYTLDGKLINSREYLKNIRPDIHIMQALQGTEYRDWSINKDFLVRKISSGGTEKERITLIMQKGSAKKTIQLDNNGKMIASQEGEHAELADANW